MFARIKYLLILFAFFSKSTIAQTVVTNSQLEDSLGKISSQIWKQKTDSDRLYMSNDFFTKFRTALQTDSAFAIPFDSIFGITHVASEDGLVRIYTWNLPLADGSNKYFGFIQIKSKTTRVIPLISVPNLNEDFASKQIIPQNWYGALYYKIIPVKINDITCYTLLGWDGYTAVSNRKIIDIISINSNDDLFFGMPVFKTEKGIKSRVILEYAENSKMLLRYDYQAIKIQKRKKIKKENTWLIVMDRLIPMDPTMEGNKRYYVPAGNIYDGFIFLNGYWVLAEDLEVVNLQ